jgi:hypothetical protein
MSVVVLVVIIAMIMGIFTVDVRLVVPMGALQRMMIPVRNGVRGSAYE